MALYANRIEVEDTLSYNDETTRVRPQKFVLPATLIIIGSWGICNNSMQSANHTIRNNMDKMRDGHFFHADDYIQYLPVISHLSLGSIGAESKHNFKERLAITATAYLTMGIIVNGIKIAVNEKRPDSSAKNSFPSGHTATAFMGAELVRIEYGNTFGTGAYIIAGSIAFLRLYNDRHWLNDVIAGAGIGILSARIGYFLLPLNQKLFKLHRKNAPLIAAMPTYHYHTKSFGVAINVQF